MQLVHTDRPALTATEFTPVGSEALSIFSLDHVDQELAALRKALRLPSDLTPEVVEDEEWIEILNDLLGCLAPVLDGDTVSDWSCTSTRHELAAVKTQLDRAQEAVKYARKCVDEHGSATGALLPATLPRRLAVLLGHGVLPLAWVRELDLLRF